MCAKLKWLPIFIVIAFVYSGFLKWLPLPIDPTIILGSVFALLLLRNVLFKKKHIYSFNVYCLTLILTTFIVYYISTAFYTPSENFWKEKIAHLVIALFVFFYCIISFTDPNQFKMIRNVMIGLCVVEIIALGYLESTGLLELYTQYATPEFKAENKIPDYLALSSILSIGFILVLPFNHLLSWLFRVAIIYLMIRLSARGPIIFLLGCSLLYIVRNKKLRIINFKYLIIAICSISILSIILVNWEGADILLSRFSGLQRNQVDNSVLERLDFIDKSLKIIKEKPFTGIGIGAFGFVYEKVDSKLYPHNYFLEAFVETGLLGGAAFLAFWIIFFTAIKIDYKDPIYSTLFLVTLFLFLNDQKSGGFIESRISFLWAGIVLSYVNLQKSLIKNELYK
ncbi:MAG TPA: O-antigen ligase family protein [Chitinophagaceae bacterium]|nr:O-antigen ligase family protein [Chitinophagaceae bacterium]